MNLLHVKELSPTNHTTNTALLFDAVMLLAVALKQIGPSLIESSDPSRINCYDPDSTWSKGDTLLNFMRSVRQTANRRFEYLTHTPFIFTTFQSNYTGLSGVVEFDTNGLRSNVQIDILSLEPEGLIPVSCYNPTDGIVPIVSVKVKLFLDIF